MSITDLPEAAWLRNCDTQAIFAALDGARGRTRAVGGVVRDTLLERPRDNPDIDLATELLPDEVIARAEAAGIAWYPTGITHGTVTLRLGDILAEVTTLRRDAQTDGRHAKVVFGTDWVEDARRRDFTMNALYCTADGTLRDPLGGLDDALHHRVRFIGDAGQRIAEDGLRVYRFFRFCASHGREVFDAGGLSACAGAVTQLSHISAERIGAEVLRMLALPRIARTLAEMTTIGLLAIAPARLNLLAAYEQLGGHSAAARLALLGDLEALRTQWRLSNDIVAAAGKIRHASELLLQGRIGEAAYRHSDFAAEAVTAAGALGGWAAERQAEVSRELGAVAVSDFPVSGHDLLGLGLAPGPALGDELLRLERAWIEGGFRLQKAELLALVRH